MTGAICCIPEDVSVCRGEDTRVEEVVMGGRKFSTVYIHLHIYIKSKLLSYLASAYRTSISIVQLSGTFVGSDFGG